MSSVGDIPSRSFREGEARETAELRGKNAPLTADVSFGSLLFSFQKAL
jgi:hypothetical protein